jgi:hypothetical protein
MYVTRRTALSADRFPGDYTVDVKGVFVGRRVVLDLNFLTEEEIQDQEQQIELLSKFGSSL